MHVGTVLLLLLLFRLVPLHPVYLAGVAGVAAILAWEHSLVSPTDLSQVMRAFNLNGWVSLGYFVVTAASAWLGVPR
jgi:4-hydroxybenzoate polyprenyltransferase